MKVFITGGSGFVGQEIIQHLCSAGHSVRALVRAEGSLTHFDDIEETLLKFHGIAKKWFEKAIKDNLRKQMGCDNL
jgi:nucleoside-diphosphate-sugar epimerase